MPDERTSDALEAFGSESLDLLADAAGVIFPGTGLLTGGLLKRVRQEIGRNRSTALRAAERVSGVSREDLAEVIEENPRLVPLLTRLLHAAGMNGHDRILRTMGTAFGRALRTPEEVDEAEVILASLADLTEGHAQVLAVLQEPPTCPGAEPDDAARLVEQSVWHPFYVAGAAQLPQPTADLLLSTLVARGLVETPAIGPGIYCKASTPGRIVVQLLTEYAS